MRLKAVAFLAAALLVAVAAPSQASTVDLRIVYPDISSKLAAAPFSLVFSGDGKMGFALAFDQSFLSARVFSFGLVGQNVIDVVDLVPDFGVGATLQTAPVINLALQDTGAKLIAHGRDADGNEQVVAFSFDSAGHLTRQWNRFYASDRKSYSPSSAEVAFDDGGSRVYVSHSKASGNLITRHLDLIDSLSGEVLSTMALGDIRGPVPVPANVIFDRVGRRAIAFSGPSAFILTPGSDILTQDFILDTDPRLDETFPIGFTPDGRYLVCDSGILLGKGERSREAFVTIDLVARKAIGSNMDVGSLFPVTGEVEFSAQSGLLAAPDKIRLVHSQGSISVEFSPTSQIEVDQIADDGSITRNTHLSIPRDLNGGSGVDAVPFFSIVALSRTGVLVFAPTLHGRLLAFDTSSGEIADEVSIPSSPDTSIQLLESQGLVAYSNNTNVLSFVSVSTAPSVTSVHVDKRSMTIIGRIFLDGAHVSVNGESAGTARRDAADPSHQITINRGKKDFPSGSTLTVTVVNRDGATSSPFTVTL